MTKLVSQLPKDWKIVLKEEFQKEYFKTLSTSIEVAYDTTIVLPPAHQLYTALSLCPFQTVKVVIIGQDPYHGPGQAHGLAFSVQDGTKIPPSLKNIYKELHSDIGKPIPNSGNLEHWATQGVLLLNSILTVESQKPSSHQKLGWEIFTNAVIKKISDEKEHIVFILWGNFARGKKSLIDTIKHLVLEAPHPSPFSAHTGFFGCRHFSQTNQHLRETGQAEIIW